MPSELVSGEALPIWLGDGHLLNMSFRWPFLWACVETETSLVPLHLPIRSPVLWDEGPTLTSSFKLNYLPKGSISKYSLIGGYGFNV